MSYDSNPIVKWANGNPSKKYKNRARLNDAIRIFSSLVSQLNSNRLKSYLTQRATDEEEAQRVKPRSLLILLGKLHKIKDQEWAKFLEGIALNDPKAFIEGAGWVFEQGYPGLNSTIRITLDEKTSKVYELREINTRAPPHLLLVKAMVKNVGPEYIYYDKYEVVCNNCETSRWVKVWDGKPPKKIKGACKGCGEKETHNGENTDPQHYHDVFTLLLVDCKKEEDVMEFTTKEAWNKVGFCHSFTPELKQELHSLIGEEIYITCKKISHYNSKTQKTEIALDCLSYRQANPKKKEFSPARIAELQKFSKQDPIKTCVQEIFGFHSGNPELKIGLLLQLAGCYDLNIGSGLKGMIHCLVIGDPETGKSALMKAMVRYSPKGIFKNANGVSTAAITVGVVDDPIVGRYAEPGVMPLAHNGILALDEFDKAKPDVQDRLHTPMVEGMVQESKMGAKCDLPANTSIVCTANPRDEIIQDLDGDEFIAQVPFKKAIVSRFSMIFVTRESDLSSEKKEETQHRLVDEAGVVDYTKVNELVKDYIAWIRTLEPVLPKEIAKHLSSQLRKNTGKAGFRRWQASLRLTVACARLHGREVVTMDDALTVLAIIDDQKKLRAVSIEEVSIGTIYGEEGQTDEITEKKLFRVVYNILRDSEKPLSFEEILSEVGRNDIHLKNPKILEDVLEDRYNQNAFYKPPKDKDGVQRWSCTGGIY